MGEQLLWGVKNGDLDVVKECVEKPGFKVNDDLLNGRSALHYAADYGQDEVVDYLIKKGADVNDTLFNRFSCKSPDKFGITALLAAVYEGHVKCVEILLKNGADKTRKAPDGQSYIDCAEDVEIKELLKYPP